MITVVVLGVEENDLRVAGVEAIKNADAVVVKTALTPTYNYFIKNNIPCVLLDDYYNQANDFEELNQNIFKYLQKAAEGINLVYAVNGCGADDGSVILLAKNMDLKIISGVSHGDKALNFMPSSSNMCYSAYDILGMSVFMPQKRVVLTVREIDNSMLAGDLKIKLTAVYGDEADAILVTSGKAKKICLCEMDREKKYDYSTTLIIPPVSLLKAERYDFADLIEIMYVLTGDNGCPWDKAQTHESIRINVIEEAYELVQAIDNGDLTNLCEETGDVLLQAVFHGIIGEIDGEYDNIDTLTMLCKKLIFRHTHIFGENKAANATEALKSWDAAKGVEKQHTTLTEKMESIPKNLPALLYAYKMQKVAVKCGFDWPNIEGTYDKLNEEICE
jgi:tetrapyrrole methylase family protein/MazG family protein